jgi:hypothetical protein
MKTAISIPDNIFKSTAGQLRSKFATPDLLEFMPA